MRSTIIRKVILPFSAAQTGKGSVDRMAAYMKRRVRDYLDHNNDVTNGKEFFDAVVKGGRPLQVISVGMVKLNEHDLSRFHPAPSYATEVLLSL